jgi:Mor family transcriptional regulator
LVLYARHAQKLRRIIKLAETLINESPKPRRGRPPLVHRKAAINGVTGRKRLRRSGQKLVQFRRMLRSERKRGASVAELARKYGISTAYIYMLP